jgi:hypothetical protein
MREAFEWPCITVLYRMGEPYPSDIQQPLDFQQERLVLRERIELSTSPLPMVCSTTELPQRKAPSATDKCVRSRHEMHLLQRVFMRSAFFA